MSEIVSRLEQMQSPTPSHWREKAEQRQQIMSSAEKKQYMKDLVRGLELAEYRMLRDKAMRNLTIIQSDGADGWREVSAREVFVALYNEPVPTF